MHVSLLFFVLMVETTIFLIKLTAIFKAEYRFD